MFAEQVKQVETLTASTRLKASYERIAPGFIRSAPSVQRLGMMDESKSRQTWLEHWSQYAKQGEPEWDSLCELIYRFHSRTFRPKNKVILETGSGTGRVTSRLAMEGASAVLLDISADAFELARLQFRGTIRHFVVGDISSLPFRNASFDVVWSSGVLEHYDQHLAQTHLGESRRLLRKGGILIAIVPNRGAFVYDLFRRWKMRTGRWKVGYEEPWRIKDLYDFDVPPTTHWSAGFFHQLIFIAVPKARKLLTRIVPRLSVLLDDKIPTGYLLAGVWKVLF